MIKCPCEECISFAICNAKIKSMHTPDISNFSSMIDCEILSEYIDAKPLYYVSYEIGNKKVRYRARVDKTRTLFKISPITNDVVDL